MASAAALCRVSRLSSSSERSSRRCIAWSAPRCSILTCRGFALAMGVAESTRRCHHAAVPRALLAALLVAVAATPAAAAPIPQGPGPDPPAFTGRAWIPRPVRAPVPPRHPFMAPNDRSNLHDDAWQTDTARGLGPLGRGLSSTSAFFAGDCASVTFDAAGRIVTVCVGAARPTLRVLDPRSLAVLASYDPPPRGTPGVNFFQDFSGGGYFYLDHRNRAIIPTADHRLLVVAERPGPALRLERDYGLGTAVASGEKTVAVMPDWKGRIWFVTDHGTVGWVDRNTGAVHARALGAPIKNSFAVDERGAVYVVTDRALFRLEASGSSGIRTVWRVAYANDGRQKPGQSQAGSGTTPTVVAGKWIAFTNNADPIRVVVVRRGRAVHGRRLVCSVPVFTRGAGSTDQSLIAAGRAIVAENNYGYTGPLATERGNTTEPGLERVDVHANGRGCVRRWRSAERAPSVVPKVSLDAGLVYTYTKPAGDERDPWYLTALDFRSGRTVWKALAGRGLGFNNNYAPVSIGPDGAAGSTTTSAPVSSGRAGAPYAGALGGLGASRDATRPSRPRPARLGLAARCRGHTARGRLTGTDEPVVTRVRFRVGAGRRRL